LREVEWNVALDYVSHALKDIVARHGGESVAALASPQSTLEELHLLQKMTRGLGSGNIDFRPRRRDFSSDGRLAGAPWMGLRLADIAALDAVLVVGSFLRKDHPLLAQRLRQLAKRAGQVSLLSVTADDPLIKLHAQRTVAPAALVEALASVVKAVAELKNVAVPPGLESLQPCATSQTMAKSLLCGDKRAILLGSVAEQSPHAAQLHALAAELANLTGASFGFIGAAANSVGGHVAQALPTALNAYEMFAQPRRAYLLFGLEPELDCYNPQLTVAALKQADLTVMLTPFKHTAALDYADVLLPLAAFTETSGTFISGEGRAQSFNGVCRPPGDARPGWKMLRVLGNLLEIPGFDYTSSEQIRDQIFEPGTEFVAGLDNAISGVGLAIAAAADTLQRIAEVPIYFADPLVRRADALQQTSDAAQPAARMNQDTLARLGFRDGEPLRVTQGAGAASLSARLDSTVPDGCVRIAAAHPLTASLGDMFGAINVERA
jgi:NADH-quinone oxidoreductase subunit G